MKAEAVFPSAVLRLIAPAGYAFEWPEMLEQSRGPQIVALYNAVIRSQSIIGYRDPISPTEGQVISQALSEAVRRRDKHLFLVTQGEEIVGIVILTPSSLPNCRHLVELSKGIIHPAHRRNGLLRRAFLEVALRCRELQAERILLDVREGSRSHRLWSHLGFEAFGRLEDYARVDGVSHPGVYMQQATIDLIDRLQGDRDQGSNSC